MKKTILILAVAALAAGCHDSSNTLRRDQQNYGVVQEGATGSAPSTLTAAGGAPPPMTATNADTTSNLALMPGVATAPGQPGNIAGTMMSDQSGSMNVGYANDGASATPRPRVARTAAPRVATTEATTQPESQPLDTTAAPAAPPMTSAGSVPTPSRSQPPTAPAAAPSPSTDTAPAADSADQKAKDKPKDSNPEPPPSTDTSTTTAPPPTQT